MTNKERLDWPEPVENSCVFVFPKVTPLKYCNTHKSWTQMKSNHCRVFGRISGQVSKDVNSGSETKKSEFPVKNQNSRNYGPVFPVAMNEDEAWANQVMSDLQKTAHRHQKPVSEPPVNPVGPSTVELITGLSAALNRVSSMLAPNVPVADIQKALVMCHFWLDQLTIKALKNEL